LGMAHELVAPTAGLLFSAAALSGAAGHHFCGRLLTRHSPRNVISGAASLAAGGAILMAAAGAAHGGAVWVLAIALALFGLGIGTASTASYTAAGLVIPAGSHGTAFGLLSSASLAGLAVSPLVSGILADISMRGIFVLDLAIMLALAMVVRRTARPVAAAS
jgi:MFS family permease